MLGTSAHVWINLERDYRYNLARLQNLAKLKQEAKSLKLFPVKQAQKFGWIKTRRTPEEKADEVLAFFGIDSFAGLPGVQQAAFRRSRLKQASPQAPAMWIRKGEMEAAKITTSPYQKTRLKKSLEKMRALTRTSFPGNIKALVEVCARTGVALVIVPHLSKSFVYGAVFWPASDKAVVQLSLRYKRDDAFWFSFFHELGHVILHGGKKVFLDEEGLGGNREEKEADRFAADTLIPPPDYCRLVEGPYHDRKWIVSCARNFGIAPGIMTGRLQFEGLLPCQTPLNTLKVSYDLDMIEKALKKN